MGTVPQPSSSPSPFVPLFELGRGGMGYVLAAYDARTKARIAVKRLLPELRDDRSRGMFTREAKLLTQLHHPNIVRGISYGEDDEGPFLVMDLVNGVTLDELISASPEGVPEPIACRILADVAAGLSAAHELVGEDGEPMGLVHRDVTPHNVVLDWSGRTLLFDFGVAKIDRSARLSKTGEVKGKTGYMSPEQAMGDPLDPRSDLFAVGALLYELVTGSKMWPGTEIEVLRSLALASPPELPERVSPRLRALYTRLVARKVEERPADAREVEQAFQSLGTASSEELAKFLREHLPRREEEASRRFDEAATKRGNQETERGAGSSKKPDLRLTLLVLAASVPVALFLLSRPWSAASTVPDPRPSELPSAVREVETVALPSPSVSQVVAPPSGGRPTATSSVKSPTGAKTAPRASGSAAPKASSDVDPNPI